MFASASQLLAEGPTLYQRWRPAADDHDTLTVTAKIAVNKWTPNGTYSIRRQQRGNPGNYDDFEFVVTNGVANPAEFQRNNYPIFINPPHGQIGMLFWVNTGPTDQFRKNIEEFKYVDGGLEPDYHSHNNNPTQHYTGSVTLDMRADPNMKPCDDKSGGNQDCRGCGGMARYSVHSMMVSLNIQDTPVGYAPPRGPAINFTATYNQRDNLQPATFTYSNLGPNWTFNWLSYITDDPIGQLASTYVYVPGGGAEIHRFDSGSFLPDPQSHSVLVRTVANTYEKRFPDGSVHFFEQSDGDNPRRLFMTRTEDPAGNTVHIDYDPIYPRIARIRDAMWRLGAADAAEHETTFHYDDEGNDLRITRVTDPYGREAQFDYYPSGKLHKITDVIGIVSEFTYVEDTVSINSLTTPYGTTTFQEGQVGTNRWIEITDPEGGKERIEYRDGAGVGSGEVAPDIVGIVNENLDSANTFYWDKKAMSLTSSSPPAYTTARIKHWLYNENGTLSGIISSEKKSLENRVWYTYADQPDYQHVGSTANPSQIALVLGDNTTQLYQYEYNDIGKTTKSADPVDRVTTYGYDSNGIDLLEVRQKRGASSDLLQSFESPYYLHKPRTVYDAAGQATVYDYNGYGQVVTETNAKGEVTTYTYDRNDDNDQYTDGYLVLITNPSGGTSIEYDDFKRARTVTNDVDEYSVTTDYDSLDRKTRITYPDGSHEDFEYTQDFGQGPTTKILDLTVSKDRLGRPTVRHYNRNRQMDSITEPGETGNPELRKTLYGWCNCGSLTSVTDPKGNSTSFTRDLQSRIIAKTIGQTTTVSYIYEPGTSRLASRTDALNQTTIYHYYRDDNLAQVSYSGAQNPTAAVDYHYHGDYNRIEDITSSGPGAAGSGLINYTYHPVGGLGAGKVETTGGTFANDTIAYTYDELGRVLSRSINNVAETMTYDEFGRVTTVENALTFGQRVFDRQYVGSTSRVDTLTYPNGTQQTTYTYFGNEQDRRVETIQNVVGNANLSQFDYDHDPEGQIKSWAKLLDTTSSGLWFDYDNAKQLRSARNASNANAVTRRLEYDYDAAGNRTDDRNYDPNWPSQGVANSYGINALNQIETRTVTSSGASLEPQVFVYDAVGNVTDDGAGKTFEWDAANRLVAINYLSNGNRSEFAYDGLGRRVKIFEYGPGVTAEGEPTDSDYATFTAGPFTLPAGNCTLTFQGLNPNGGNNTVLVDSVTLNNVLVDNGSFEDPTVANYQVAPTNAAPWGFLGTTGIANNQGAYLSGNPPTTGGTQVAFITNRGSLSQNLSLSANSYTLRFKAAQRGSENESSQRLRVIFRSSASVTEVKTFVWCGNEICEERDGSGANVTKRFFADGEQRIKETAVNYYYTRDHLGSIREVTDENGNLQAQYDYDPFGNRVVLSGQMDLDFGYTGHYFHAPSGLNLTLYRAYNPALGRWISRDPLNNAETLEGPNLYSYVANDPVGQIDLLGLFRLPIFAPPKPYSPPRPIPMPPGPPGLNPPDGGGGSDDSYRCAYTCPDGSKREHYQSYPCKEKKQFPATDIDTGKPCTQECRLNPGGQTRWPPRLPPIT